MDIYKINHPHYLLISVELRDKKHILCYCGMFNSMSSIQTYIESSELSLDIVGEKIEDGIFAYTAGDVPNYYISFDIDKAPLHLIKLGEIVTL